MEIQSVLRNRAAKPLTLKGDESHPPMLLEFKMPFHALIFCCILIGPISLPHLLGEHWFVKNGFVCDEKGREVGVYGVDRLNTLLR